MSRSEVPELRVKIVESSEKALPFVSRSHFAGGSGICFNSSKKLLVSEIISGITRTIPVAPKSNCKKVLCADYVSLFSRPSYYDPPGFYVAKPHTVTESSLFCTKL